MPFRRSRTVSVLALLAIVAAAEPAGADSAGSLSVGQTTTVGVHNTYDKSAYTYLADALDAGANLVELDAWVNVVTHKWNVGHSSPLSSNNNCVQAAKAADLHTGNRNQNLDSCLDDIRIWLGAHPGHGPIVVKLEMKNGFNNSIGMGPAALDAYVAAHLGQTVFRPADLLAMPGGGSYPDLDTAARAGNWPSRDALAGKAIVEAIPGTLEEKNPFDHLWTDEEYADHLRDLAASGDVGRAQIFPTVLGAVAGDPRTRYSDTTIRPWFVVFDGDASTYLTKVDTSWYDGNHYLLVMTDAQSVPPAIDATNPTVQQAQARVAQLAAAHASVVSSDWRTLTSVLSEVLPRGTN